MENTLAIKEYKLIGTQELTAIMYLWNEVYPVQLNFASIDQTIAYVGSLGNTRHFFLVGNDHIIYGWAALFERNHADWFVVILAPKVQKLGFGKALVDRLKKEADSLSGWVVDQTQYIRSDGTLYQSPIDFYLKTGFRVCPEERLETENLSAAKILWENRKKP